MLAGSNNSGSGTVGGYRYVERKPQVRVGEDFVTDGEEMVKHEQERDREK